MSTPHTDRASGAMSAAAAAGPGHPVAAPSLRALVDAATPGPWHEGKHWVSGPGLQTIVCGAYNEYGCGPTEDAAFIAACREAVPLLLDVLEAATALRDPPTRDPDDLIERLGLLHAAVRAFETWERER